MAQFRSKRELGGQGARWRCVHTRDFKGGVPSLLVQRMPLYIRLLVEPVLGCQPPEQPQLPSLPLLSFHLVRI